MANEKILIFETDWFEEKEIEASRSIRHIYSSAETLLGLGDPPVRVVRRPLISDMYQDDIEDFVDLDCNRKGVNIVIFYTHGSYEMTRKGRHRRTLETSDYKDVNISVGIRELDEKLDRTILVLDTCEVGKKVSSFREAAGAAAAVGFGEKVDWKDASVFVFAMLLNFRESGVFQADTREAALARAKNTIRDMLNGTYRSFKDSLGVECSFERF